MTREMLYSEFVEVYEALASIQGRLEKTGILADFLKDLLKKGESEWIYLLKGKVVADYDARETGISEQLAIKAIAKGFGVREEEIVKKFRKIGDFGEIAEEFCGKRKQSTLFSGKLSVKKVFDNLRKIMDIEGKGAVERKIGFVSELLGDASDKEAKYIVRTLLGDLRIGVSDGIIRDAIALAFFGEEKKEMAIAIDEAYDLAGSWAEILEAASEGKKGFRKINIVPGKPVRVMLPVKVEDIKEAFRICGTPLAIEHKYDGFRMVITKDKKGEIKLFTRRLEEVTKQFPDVVSVVRKNVRGESFILDSEVVGYDSDTGKYKPFESVSQRIKRKYDIKKLERELPVEVNVFDVLYLNGQSLLEVEFRERRKSVEKIVKPEKLKIRASYQIVVDSEARAEEFYKQALKMGEEGIMFKKLDAPYKSGRRVGYIVKLKPSVKDLDLVIVGAEYGRGKRAGWLTSYILGCASNGKFLEVGKVSSGLKELEEAGTTYKEITELLKPLILETKGNIVKVKPKLIVSVTYQNIQRSPSYDSGFALRFPRITAYRPDRSVRDIASLEEIGKEMKKENVWRKGL